MNTSMRARRDARGFSMVELLVTIIIAGIAFAAIVPLFVMAQDKNSGDTFRNVATQMAQDRIELIRQLDYDQINDPNLNSDNFPTDGAKLFSTIVPYDGGSNSSMTFRVRTRVTLVPTTATLGSEQFKTVTVVTWWGPADDPAEAEKLTKLQTQVYKQYAGPQVLTFTAGTLMPQPYGASLYWITEMPLTLEAVVDEIDRPETGSVHFSISGVSISDASSETSSTDVATTTTSPGTYTWVFAGPMNDGLYTVSAQAKSTKNFSGNLVSLPLTVEQGSPPMPVNVQAQSGVGSVSLSWDASPAADLDHFEVYRSDRIDGTYAKRGETTGNESPSYVDIDTRLSVGQDYYYIVYAVDKMGSALEAQGATYRSDPSFPSVQVLMEASDDTNPPPAPAWIDAPFSPSSRSVTLVWNTVIDVSPPSVPSGTQAFIVTRQSSSNGGTTWANPVQLPIITFDPLVSTQSVTDNSLAYGMTYRYQVQAMDFAGNSSFSEWTSVTVEPVGRTLTVQNSQSGTGQKVYVYVTDTFDLVFYDQDGNVAANAAAATVTIDEKGSAAWGLALGGYHVHYSTSATGPFLRRDAPAGTDSVRVPKA